MQPLTPAAKRWIQMTNLLQFTEIRTTLMRRGAGRKTRESAEAPGIIVKRLNSTPLA
ncbi:hypothetical protein PY730_27870 (plasmid) [Klebsiella pneumoniae]|nr:hypothetical protein PY730_27870 [Klebsiella pneumoniae]